MRACYPSIFTPLHFEPPTYKCNVNVNLSRVYLYFGLAGIRIRVENSLAPSTSGWFRALFLSPAAIPPVVTPLYKPRDPDTQDSQLSVLGWLLLLHWSWLMLWLLRALLRLSTSQLSEFGRPLLLLWYWLRSMSGLFLCSGISAQQCEIETSLSRAASILNYTCQY